MIVTLGALLLGLVALHGSATAARGDEAAAVQSRVAHHVRQAVALADHFDGVLHGRCPRFATAAEWQSWLDAEVDRAVLLSAHVEQAWVEARATSDDRIRRAAKAPRRRLVETRALLDKLSTCAADHGESLPVWALWRRVVREVPERQAEIALPR